MASSGADRLTAELRAKAITRRATRLSFSRRIEERPRWLADHSPGRRDLARPARGEPDGLPRSPPRSRCMAAACEGFACCWWRIAHGWRRTRDRRGAGARLPNAERMRVPIVRSRLDRTFHE